MNVIRIVVAGGVAGAAAWAVVPASAQTKKAPAKEVVEPAAIAKPDQADLDRSQIIGNRELPKVMYVVPWKKPDLGDFAGRPAKSLLDELLEPVDRDVFRRQNRYFSALQPDAATSSASADNQPAAIPARGRDEK